MYFRYFFAVQRFPPGLQFVLQSFELWLLQRLQEQDGFLKHFHLAAQYRSSLISIPRLESFKEEVADQLSKDLQASEDSLPPSLVKELQRGDYFWKQYVEDWLITLAGEVLDPERASLHPELALLQPRSSQGKY